MWILAAAATGLIVVMKTEVELPWNVGALLASLWLAFNALGLLWRGRAKPGYFPTFMKINIYALLVMVCLVGDAVS